MQRARSPAPACTAPIDWPAILYWKDWCTARVRPSTMRQETKLVQISKAEPPKAAPETAAATETKAADDIIRQMQDIMWRDVGIVRSRETLQRAIEQLETLEAQLAPGNVPPLLRSRQHLADRNADREIGARRLESRGAHYRLDYPMHDDAKFKKHSIASGEKIRFE